MLPVIRCGYACLVLFCATVGRKGTQLVREIQLRNALCHLFFNIFRKNVKNVVQKLAWNIYSLYICNDFKNEMQKG